MSLPSPEYPDAMFITDTQPPFGVPEQHTPVDERAAAFTLVTPIVDPVFANKQLVITDLDGTLANSFGFWSKKLADNGGLPAHMTPSHFRAIYGTGWLKMYREFGVGPLQLATHAWRARGIFKQAMDDVEAFEAPKTLLRGLKQARVPVHVLTSASQRNAESFLDRTGLAEYVDDATTGVSFFGKAKHLRRIAHTYNVPIEDTVHLADEARDIRASHDVGMDSIGATWGFSGRAAFERTKPTRLATSGSELLQLFGCTLDLPTATA
ncbi:MAG TPA: HAD hydrolase-like protein [Candidatus Microsaccharimonas sp.]|nr:HAD hydrolase-like protein [Candidatus Microsaccharimonas sp.]